ncbi:uncharacterized protein K444DRAFT_166541 [Hyaloscypha bicolor E]|uniref:Uncharacterized protein n=1 Tax=Hyaloscypha bicolor E TaxID=1095630 RepID=A0A2J6TT81_9HELO|nr:uncharacterized protein K444DRAFT_166541 [Hyaloscypha bicolor E]PMD66217.1 hypothetical protein K444DRAFT_166541 [Hyaloscypha bicolor E]
MRDNAHTTSPHLTSPHLTSPHLTSPHHSLAASSVLPGQGAANAEPKVMRCVSSDSHVTMNKISEAGPKVGTRSGWHVFPPSLVEKYGGSGEVVIE